MLNYDMVPVKRMTEGVRRYVEQGILTGSFLISLFENNFVNVYRCADNENKANLIGWASFLHWEMPMEAWGSRDKVLKWTKARQKERLSDNIVSGTDNKEVT